jgi:hypothetical protein
VALTWQVTDRFLREYRRASPPLQMLAEQEVRRMQVVGASRKDWMGEWRRLRGVAETVLELELGGGPRLLAHVGGRAVTLIAMGDHEVTTRYARRGHLATELRRVEPLPAGFSASPTDSLFPPAGRVAPERLAGFAGECAPDWLYFLDVAQSEICDGIVEAIEEVLAGDDGYTVDFIVGGPGTGKTSILLQLLKRLSDQVEQSGETWRVGLSLSDPVAEYVSTATGWPLDRSRVLANQPGAVDVLLVDDPRDPEEITAAARAVQTAGPLKAVVVAFDPLQLSHSLTDADYDAMVEAHEAEVWRLRDCYRQKEVVGSHALKIAKTVAESSPYLDETKQRRHAKAHRKLTNRANFLNFRNPSGYVVTHLDAALRDWREHLRWIARQRPLWEHWPPLLMIVEDGIELPPEWVAVVDAAELVYERIRLSELEAIKGLEYQHVVLVLSHERHADLEQGFSGSGRSLYDDYRLLRIPFTRAKDSIAVFVAGGRS